MTDDTPLAARCMCGAGSFEEWHRYDAPPESEVRFRFSANGEYRRTLLRCARCGHFLSVHDMRNDTLYAGDYVDSTYGAEGLRRAFDRINTLPPERSDNVARVRRVLRYAAERMSTPRRAPTVLDVGSGLCVFLHRMKEAGWIGMALDQDERQVRHARDVVGVRAVRADLAEGPDLGRFDLVTFNKVLEHVPEPVALLARAAGYVAPGGAVYLELPDGEAAAAEGPGREEFFIDHPHVFSPASAALLARRAGLFVQEMERVREPSTKYTLRMFLTTV